MSRVHGLLWGLAAAPLVLLSIQVISLLQGASHNLGGDPAEAIMSELGRYALWMLLVTLLITPIRQRFPRLTFLVRSRRMLGLWAFAYAILHLVSYGVLVLGLDMSILWQDISQKPYAIAGAAALIALIPLAVTSTQGWQRRLGRRWRQLHKLSYPILVLVWIHFLWQVRVDYTEAAVYLVLGALLLGARTPIGRQFVIISK
ncbi:MAG: sulfite oxidase heme-binding subunit YedZ [Litorivicinus sp.]